ncbi:MAG: hypothetical protein IRZ07_03895 [Microbispora sp.]|nr:hypothetical protein [Microbispora sp.]
MRDTLNLLDWVKAATRGDTIEYYRGNLAQARHERAVLIDKNKPVPADLDASCARADDAWTLHERGAAHLVQRRIGANEFSYLAVRR